jgi:regulatory protein
MGLPGQTSSSTSGSADQLPVGGFRRGGRRGIVTDMVGKSEYDNAPEPQSPALTPAPTADVLHAAALAHLARYATTRAGLLRVLDRRIDRWARLAGGAGEAASGEAEARAAAREVVARLAAAGAVDDAVFAEQRARSLTRAGRSRLAVAAHLAAKGVDAEQARAALPADPDAELAAALATARRRRIGPFRAAAADPATARRELGALARAGFGQAIARRALAMEPAEAEALVIRLRRG